MDRYRQIGPYSFEDYGYYDGRAIWPSSQPTQGIVGHDSSGLSGPAGMADWTARARGYGTYVTRDGKLSYTAPEGFRTNHIKKSDNRNSFQRHLNNENTDAITFQTSDNGEGNYSAQQDMVARYFMPDYLREQYGIPYKNDYSNDVFRHIELQNDKNPNEATWRDRIGKAGPVENRSFMDVAMNKHKAQNLAQFGSVNAPHGLHARTPQPARPAAPPTAVASAPPVPTRSPGAPTPAQSRIGVASSPRPMGITEYAGLTRPPPPAVAGYSANVPPARQGTIAALQGGTGTLTPSKLPPTITPSMNAKTVTAAPAAPVLENQQIAGGVGSEIDGAQVGGSEFANKVAPGTQAPSAISSTTGQAVASASGAPTVPAAGGNPVAAIADAGQPSQVASASPSPPLPQPASPAQPAAPPETPPAADRLAMADTPAAQSSFESFTPPPATAGAQDAWAKKLATPLPTPSPSTSTSVASLSTPPSASAASGAASAGGGLAGLGGGGGFGGFLSGLGGAIAAAGKAANAFVPIEPVEYKTPPNGIEVIPPAVRQAMIQYMKA